MTLDTMLPELLALAFATLLAVTHYIAEHIELDAAGQDVIASFAAGISVTYILIELLPLLAARFDFTTRPDFIPVLAGFAGFHIGEKYIRQHERSDTLHHELKEWHAFGVGLYYFTIGVILVSLARESIVAGTLFFIPIMFNAWASILSFGEIHEALRERGTTLFLVSTAAITGVVLALLTPIPRRVEVTLFGFVVGVLFYTVLRDSIPPGKSGRLSWFIAGTVGYTTILLIIDILLATP